MKSSVRQAIAAILDTDETLSPAHRLAILSACDTQPGTAPAIGAEMTATAAAAYLSRSLPTIMRWIESGKLDGRKIGQRQTVVSSASVESLRASLAAPARPAAPLPDRLAHLADKVRPSAR